MLQDSYSLICSAGRFVSSLLGLAIKGVYAFGQRMYSWIVIPKGMTQNTANVANRVIPLADSGKPSKPESAPLENSIRVNATAPLESALQSLSTTDEGVLTRVVDTTKPFDNYSVYVTDCPNAVLTGMTVRPANLFYDALFNETTFNVTKPGSGKLFAFIDETDVRTPSPATHQIGHRIGDLLRQKATEAPNEVVSFTATGKKGDCCFYDQRNKLVKQNIPLDAVYGKNTFQMSRKEIKEVIDSQEIYTSALLPVEFYKALKKALLDDGVIELPGNEGDLKFLQYMGPHVQTLVKDAQKDFQKYGFQSQEHFDALQSLTIYQIGSMVVKSEKFYVFTDAKMQIRDRKVGDKDDIILINACGIRGIHESRTPQKYNKMIMTETFKTSLQAAASGFVVFPAVGMGVWGGDPNLYWPAFLDAVANSERSFERIFINPRHRPTRRGKRTGCDGNEFKEFLDEYKKKYQTQPDKLARLNKIVDVYSQKSDVLELAQNLKQAYPDLRVSVFNASDPDVTLGNHVGEYTNNCPHTTTTEENYTALGTNGICSEGITGIHETSQKIKGMPSGDISKRIIELSFTFRCGQILRRFFSWSTEKK